MRSEAPVSLGHLPKYSTSVMPNCLPQQIKRKEEATEKIRENRKILKGISDLCFHL